MKPIATFEKAKGRQVSDVETICELHRQLYDGLMLGKPADELGVILEKAYLVGIKLVLYLVQHKLDEPEYKSHPDKPEAIRLRMLRTQLAEQMQCGE